MKTIKENPNEVLLWIPPHRFKPRGASELLLGALLFVLLFFVACDSGKKDEDEVYAAVFEVEVADDERFLLALATEEQVAAATQRMNDGTVGVVHGTVVRGGGGFNSPYAWHLDPATVTFPDMAMELCDGRPNSDVQNDVDYWVETVRYYCPWGARIVRRVE